MGVVFDAFEPENQNEPGGPLFDVVADPERAGGWILGFGVSAGPDLGRVKVGHRVWVNSDPALEVKTRRLLEQPIVGRVAVVLTVRGRAGEVLEATLALATAGRIQASVTDRTTAVLEVSRAAGDPGLTVEAVRDKLGAVGNTRFVLAELSSELERGLFVAPSELKALRRRLVAALEAALDEPAEVVLPEQDVVAELRQELRSKRSMIEMLDARDIRDPSNGVPGARLVPLCRLPHQLDEVIALGFPEVELDWMEMVGLGNAVAKARAAGLAVTVATTRVQKPGEEGFDQRIAKLNPDAVLVRHWGALVHFSERQAGDTRRPTVHGDFSLNVTNSLTAHHLFGLGADTLTASHDLDEAQLFALLDEVDARRMTVVLHHHIPTFHTEHCVYAATLSTGKDFKTCGRPCDRHALSLVDPKGLSHPVITDVGCRNTVFEARAQSAASLVPRLVQRGVRRLRVELVRESAAETRTVLEVYQALVAGQLTAREAVRRVGVHEQFGVVRGVAPSGEMPSRAPAPFSR
jgi:putative protease